MLQRHNDYKFYIYKSLSNVQLKDIEKKIITK